MSDWQPAEPTLSPEPQAPADGAPVAPLSERHPFWGYLDLAFLLALVLPSLTVSFAVAFGAYYLLGWKTQSLGSRLLPAQFLFYVLLFLCLYALLKLRYGKPFWRSLAWTPSSVGYPLCVVLGLAAAGLAVLLGLALHAPPSDSMPIRELLKDRASVVMVCVFATTLGPLCEELAFRGFLLPLLVRSWGPVSGVILTALPFALLHGPQYSWAWQQVLLITLVGMAFGWLRLRSGSTAAATVMHAAYNLVFTVLLLMGKAR